MMLGSFPMGWVVLVICLPRLSYPRSQPRQPICRLRFRLLDRGQLGQGMDLREELLFPGSRADKSGQRNAGDALFAAARGNLADTLAHESGGINRPFANDNEIRRVEMPLDRRLPGKQIKPGSAPRAKNPPKANAHPARRTRARYPRQIAPEIFLNHLRQPPS